MRWSRGGRSGNVEVRRGRSGGLGGGFGGLPGGFGGGFGGGLPGGFGRRRRGGVAAGGGLGLVVVLLLLGTSFCGGGGGGFDVGPNLRPFQEVEPTSGSPFETAPQSDELIDFVSFVVDNIQESWAQAFAESGRRYEETQLVLFEGSTQTGCGPGSAQTGPFYCPADRQVYLDLSFFRELRDRFGAPGDFAQAYVIAHEFGHHVQNLLGISGEVRSLQQRDPGDANELSIRLELQADCLAGIWGRSAFQQDLLDPGDLEEGLGAAASVGDDRIQESTTGRIDPESWTHGSAEDRQEWFQEGFRSGDLEDCDTFS